MATCGHCGKNVRGIRDHIRAVHGFKYYCMGPDFVTYFGKNSPPKYQTDNWPDEPEIQEASDE